MKEDFIRDLARLEERLREKSNREDELHALIRKFKNRKGDRDDRGHEDRKDDV